MGYEDIIWVGVCGICSLDARECVPIPATVIEKIFGRENSFVISGGKCGRYDAVVADRTNILAS